jgi:hypothetical protein
MNNTRETNVLKEKIIELKVMKVKTLVSKGSYSYFRFVTWRVTFKVTL